MAVSLLEDAIGHIILNSFCRAAQNNPNCTRLSLEKKAP